MGDKTVTEIANEAAALVRKGWTQGESARDGDGLEVDVSSRSAVCFCAEGAVERITGWEGAGPIDQASLHLLGRSLIHFNDTPGRTAEEVARVLELAGWLANDTGEA